jgi:transposase
MTLEEQAATLRPPEILALLVQQRALQEQNAALQRQGEWLQRQLFGRKSEKRLREPDPTHLSLAGMLTAPVAPADQPPPPTETVTAYQRRFRLMAADLADESELRFGRSVPVQEILLSNPEVGQLSPDAYEVSGEKVTYRLAQRPGA